MNEEVRMLTIRNLLARTLTGQSFHSDINSLLLRWFLSWTMVHWRLLRWRSAGLLQQLAVGHCHHERCWRVGVRCSFEIEGVARLRHASRRNRSRHGQGDVR